ncbi:PhzF family phenazine biosynthesis protein [Enterococcus ureasiticus]|uniref:Phenazine biosynthesis protein PhzF n=1 Tax=Enterococcus ureasiticus TaxID=903984 RepID=A0A1E5GM62_9ENTE|nr:PhzF family phenazine biosynthesis isomerase [Enterococcus ureasiticus]OEG13705.1 phenazine biosynthesis protein PhzF [Enterococcus ureasiticus]
MSCTVLRVDAFTQIFGQGNPAGVVLDGDRYTSEKMQEIAKKVGFNETVFVCKSDTAAVKLRYFTPGHETPLCGHATIGAIFALFNGKGDCQLEIETDAGILPITYEDKTQRIIMKQAEPKFIEFKGDKAALCQSLGIQMEDLHQNLPIQYGNTGSWTLLIPVVTPAVLDKMKPNPEVFPDILKEIPRSSIHPFALISEKDGTFIARHFSSPFSGTTEDSVTGTASGVMGAYSLNHIYTLDEDKEISVSQGQHVQSEGTVSVHVTRDIKGSHQVSISGTACFNGEFEIMTK